MSRNHYKNRDLRQKGEKNLSNISLLQNRQKESLFIPSPPPPKDKVKRVTSITSVSNVTRKCGKKLFVSHLEIQKI